MFYTDAWICCQTMVTKKDGRDTVCVGTWVDNLYFMSNSVTSGALLLNSIAEDLMRLWG